jgi:predicted metal-dependent hydrolase
MPTNLVARLANKIRRKYPHLKFRIKRARLLDAFATTHLVAETGLYVITIDREVPQSLAAFLVAHEAAHAASWHMETEEHGPAFWSAYQSIYKLYEEFTA